MDRQSSIEKPTGGIPLMAELTTALAALLLAVQCLAAIVLFARRLSGAMSAAAAPGWLLAWLLTAALVAAATRALWFAGRESRGLAGDTVVLYAPLAALLLTAIAFTATGAPMLAVATVWLIAISEEAATLMLVGARIGTEHFGGGMPLWWRLSGRFRAGRQEAAKPETDLPARAGALDRHVQRIERVQAADGHDVLSGSLTTCLAAGQTRAHVHVAFCPPFAVVPRVEYRQVAGPAAGIKVGQVLPHGARFDVKLDRPAETAVQLVLEVRAANGDRDDAQDSVTHNG